MNRYSHSVVYRGEVKWMGKVWRYSVDANGRIVASVDGKNKNEYEIDQFVLGLGPRWLSWNQAWAERCDEAERSRGDD